MAVFFTCIILIGAGLVLLSIILMLAEKRRLHDYRTDIKEKKEGLISVIEDAEELISEMNRFSDYVVSQLEEKNQLLIQSMAEADLKIELLNAPRQLEAQNEAPTHYNEEAIAKILEEEKPEPTPSASPRKAKVLTFDSKRREIIKLAKSGLDSTEIARLLNCGKGEIELIAKMGR